MPEQAGPGQQHQEPDPVPPFQLDPGQLERLLALADLDGLTLGDHLPDSDAVPPVEGEGDRENPVLRADIQAALVADPDHGQARRLDNRSFSHNSLPVKCDELLIRA
jgi:hypothetical protein